MALNRVVKLIAVIALCCLAIFTGYQLAENRSVTGRHQNSISTLALPDVEGRIHQISEWQDQIVLINFWATWCAPCREEIPLFMDAQARYHGKGLQVVGVALDDPEAVRAFADDMGMQYPVLVGNEDTMALMYALGNEAGGLPYSVLTNRRHAVKYRKLGPFTSEELMMVLHKLL
ncbi:MAG: TlpA family protein disulfide reductase [Gammaproteobacteria bacterium]|nr:TlpA family protein disulfide reductase [Gammaproteobacteria bacterium]